MHVKLIAPGSQGFSEPVAQLIKISRAGLLGYDRRMLEKRAGAEFVHALMNVKLAHDEPLVHLIAIGATEDFGANRNGDGFTRKTCRDYHHTFQKHAYFYRDHRNKDPLKSYGRVKFSAWHEPMKRIELIVALNGSPEAARRNNGIFADKELEKLAAGKEIPVSMACRVAYDVCSWCGNQAPSREQYCDSIENGGHCKAGGLKHNIGSLVEMDGAIHHLHADNPHPSFFDISHVFRPADRIAYVNGYVKAAGAGDTVMSGSELAEVMGVTIPYDLLVDSNAPADVQRMLKRAYKLSDMESDIAAGARIAGDRSLLAFAPSLQEMTGEFPQLAQQKLAFMMRGLVDQRAVMPLATFIELTTGSDRTKAASIAEIVQTELPGIYTRLISLPDLVDRVQGCAYAPSAARSGAFTNWAEKQSSAWSLRSSHVTSRCVRASLRMEDVQLADRTMQKTSSVRGPAVRLAEEYALYKLAFLSAIPDDDPELELTEGLVLLQNYSR